MTPKDVKALVPISTPSYQCPVCKYLYIEETDAKACVKKCGWDAYRKDLVKRKEETRKKNMAYIRENATSPKHAMSLLIEYAKSVGLKISIKEYPNELCDIASSHGAPIDFPRVWNERDNKQRFPVTYPGFAGRWEGTIKGKCPSKQCWRKDDPDTGCLFECITDGFFTGTGCSGPEFSIGGYFFLYDFPKMLVPAGLSKTLVELFPKANGLSLVEIVSVLSPKLIEASAHPKKPLNVTINHDISILEGNNYE